MIKPLKLVYEPRKCKILISSQLKIHECMNYHLPKHGLKALEISLKTL